MARHVYIAGVALLALIGTVIVGRTLAAPAESDWPKLIQSGDRHERASIHSELRRRRTATPEQLAALYQAIEPNHDKLVRTSAITTLCVIDPEGVLPELLRLLETDRPYGTFATIMLKLIPLPDPEDRVAQLVVPWVASDDPILREKAFSCIRFLGGRAKAAEPELKRFVADPKNDDRERHEAARGLLGLLVDAHPSLEAARKADPETVKVAYDRLRGDNDEEVWRHARIDVQKFGALGGRQ